jgi:anti-anti-sigma regulatory factor
MEFKTDTKDTFSVITPVTENLDANLSDLLREKCAELQQNGSTNFIVDLSHCIKMEKSAVNEFIKMHEDFYSAEQSLVFTGINESILSALKENETDLLLNIAPKMQEAIDIVSMEILERDLFNEE